MKRLASRIFKLHKNFIFKVSFVVALSMVIASPAFAAAKTTGSFLHSAFLGKIASHLGLEQAEQINSVGHVDTSVPNRVKVCRDVTCGKITPGVIDFNVFPDNNPLTIDTTKGISGEVYGGDLGTINFQPPYGGVYFADPATGLLKGTAWSETSGVINFSVTGQKVYINPKTGEFSV